MAVKLHRFAAEALASLHSVHRVLRRTGLCGTAHTALVHPELGSFRRSACGQESNMQTLLGSYP